MAVSSGVKYEIALWSLIDLAGDNHLSALDLRVLLYMVATCEFHVLPVFSIDSFHVEASGQFPPGTAGCYIYNGKRTEICADLQYNVPQNVSRSISTLITRGYLSRTNLLGLRTMFAFVVHPRFFVPSGGDTVSAVRA